MCILLLCCRTGVVAIMEDLNLRKATPTVALSDVPVFDTSDEKDIDVISSDVPKKYMGTENDRRDMIVLGKKQVLRRNFGFTTMLGFGSTVICSWEVVLP